jgi:hypothetical protein
MPEIFEKNWPMTPQNGWRLQRLVVNMDAEQVKEVWVKEGDETAMKATKAMKADKGKKAMKDTKAKKAKKAMKAMKAMKAKKARRRR